MPYDAWLANLAVPILIIIEIILGRLGLNFIGSGIIVLIVVILATVLNIKLKLGKIAYLGPILYYVNIISSFLLIKFIQMWAMIAILGADVSVTPIIDIVVILYIALFLGSMFCFFKTASRLKKRLPSMKADRIMAREAYKETLQKLEDTI